MTQANNLEQAVQSHLDSIGGFGKDPDGGWTRLAFSPEEDAAFGYAAGELANEEYSIRIDGFGNLIASKNGKDPSKKRVMIGTHLDTVKNGGNYDGVVGFISAIEAMKIAEEEGQLDYGVDIVIFRAEESTRFKRACLGSSAAFGFLAPADIDELEYEDVINGSTTLKDKITARGGLAGLIGSTLIHPDEYDGYFETHIEQARVLEVDEKEVGIVTSIRAPERNKIVVKGKDTIKAVAEMVLAVENIATQYTENGDDIVGTVGKLNGYFHGKLDTINAIPGETVFNINTISGGIEFNVDSVDEGLAGKYTAIAEMRGLKYQVEEDGAGYKIIVIGTTDHSGGTPMGLQYRKDALAAACEMVLVTPRDTLPDCEEITFFTDLRSNNKNTRTHVQSDVQNKIYELAKYHGCDISQYEQTEKSEPIGQLDPELQGYLREAADQLGVTHMDLPSGAGHDAMKAALAGISTAMLFVPSQNGLSHNSDEYTENKYIAAATKVLAQALVNRNNNQKAK